MENIKLLIYKKNRRCSLEEAKQTTKTNKKAGISYEDYDHNFEYFSEHPIDYSYIEISHSGRYNEINIFENLSDELVDQVVNHHIAKIRRELIEPNRQKLHDNSVKASEFLQEEKKIVSGLEKERRKLSAKIETIVQNKAKISIPWEIHKIVICVISGIAAIVLIAWATFNARNMAISSFPVFATNPSSAWGIGAIYIGIALFFEFGPNILNFDDFSRKIYHSIIIIITIIDIIIWSILFSKTAGLMGENGGIDVNALLEAPPELFGLSAEFIDFIFTTTQTSLEFLIPSLIFMYINYEFRMHSHTKSYISVEDNPAYIQISNEIDGVRKRIGEYSEVVSAPSHFERLVPEIEKEYKLNVISTLTKLHKEKQTSTIRNNRN